MRRLRRGWWRMISVAVFVLVSVSSCYAEEGNTSPKESSKAGESQKPEGAEESAHEEQYNKLRPGVIPQIKVANSATASVQEAVEIRELIKQLAAIDNPDVGFSGTMGGSNFLPVEGSAQASVLLFANHQHKRSPALKRLVELGPKSLPFLLEALEDKTPTKLEMKLAGMFTFQEYGIEVGFNTAIPGERAIKEKYRNELYSFRTGETHNVKKHVMTVGDLCFAAVGQIVNRGYEAARYQPSGGRVFNSPTHDPVIATIVRETWKSDTPAQKLMDSLLMDYFTEADELQCGAAMRLLYYFPGETTEMIAKRIRGFDLSVDGEGYPTDQASKTNGVSVGAFLQAVRFSSQPAITEALLGIIEQSSTASSFLEALSEQVVKKSPEKVFQRMKEFLSKVPPADAAQRYSPEKEILRQSTRYFPDRSRELFELYRKHGVSGTAEILILGLEGPTQPREWMVSFLAGFLDDKTETWHTYGPQYDSQPVRVCDLTARVLAIGHLKGVRFEYEENAVFLDQQIAKLKRVLAGETNVSFENPHRFLLPADLPERKAKRVVMFEDQHGSVLPISTEKILWLTGSVSKGEEFIPASLKVDGTTGKILEQFPLAQEKYINYPLWSGNIERSYIYDYDAGGPFFIYERRTGKLLKKIDTPFHGDKKEDDPLHVDQWNHLAVCGPHDEWILAVTTDLALHSVRLDNGEHRIEIKGKPKSPEGRHEDLHQIPMHGTSLVLLDAWPSEAPVILWDQATRTRRTFEKIPASGWNKGWGDYAWREMNGVSTLWNLATGKELKLPECRVPIRTMECSRDLSRIYFQRYDGSVEGYQIVEGKQLKPLRRFVSPTAERKDVSIVLSEDGKSLFWVGSAPRPSQDEEEEKPKGEGDRRLMIAIFECGE